ncbi:MAG: hypothetical protein AAFX65_06705 [Cyanobacteria bacterium J06638_7]
MGSPIDKGEFLRRARERFGEKYDYSAIVYKSYKTPIRIRCSLHPVKEILITPEKHLQTTGGCKFCLREMRVSMLERELNRGSAERLDLEVPADLERRAAGSGCPPVDCRL